MVSVIEYIKGIQIVFEASYYLTQERCLCCRSRWVMKLVMISVVQNSAVDAFTSSTEKVVTDAEVRDKHKAFIRAGWYDILLPWYKVCADSDVSMIEKMKCGFVWWLEFLSVITRTHIWNMHRKPLLDKIQSWIQFSFTAFYYGQNTQNSI